MIRIQEFTRLQICNLFTYYCDPKQRRQSAKLVLNLKGSSDERPVVLISGRNGMGKTSLLNCLRLLFFGPTPMVQERGLRVRGGAATNEKSRGARYAISEKSFVLGIPGVWDGVLNTRARESGHNDFFIDLSWKEQGGECKARRSWILLSPSDYRETVVFERGETRLEGAAANEALKERLPEYFAPFYLFDGEDLQDLAETFLVEPPESQPTGALADLVGVRQISNLQATLSEISRSLPRRARLFSKGKEERRLIQEIDELEAELQGVEDEEKATRQEVTKMKQSLEETDAYLARLREVGLDGPRGRAELEQELSKIESQTAAPSDLERLRQFMASAFLLVRPDLVSAVVKHLEAAENHPTDESRRLLEQLGERLVPCILQPPYSSPRLTRGQQEFYVQRVQSILLEFQEASGSRRSAEPVVDSVRMDEVSSVLDELRPYATEGEHHEYWRAWLEERAQRRARAEELTRIIKESSDVDNDTRSKFEEALKRSVTLRAELKAQTDLLSSFPKRRKQINQQISSRRGQLSQVQETITESRILVDMGALAGVLADEVIAAYLNEFQRALTRELSALTTEHYTRDLMSSHHLIGRVEITKTLTGRLFDKNGRRIGGKTPSEGMKQLLATSLLWALSDFTKHHIPLVIDTPMGRLDAAHRKNLVERYFPCAARQVLLFPTEGELDRDLYKLLEPSIYREYRIENPDGRSAHFETGKLWS
ncbi:MAG: AAA family ATPase [Nannocystaceae bacterium]